MKSFFKNGFLFLALLLSLFASSQVPSMESYPASSNVILLDFDGHVVQGTSWNSSGSFTCNPSNLTTDQMIAIYNRVAEDYRPFKVNVTTDSTKYAAAPADHRMRIVFTTSWEWYGSAGGVSYINSFTWGDNTPCFVFTSLLNYNTKNIAEAAAHEAGHTLGLRHQSAYDASCNKTSEYNPGVGNGETSWAPIMGIGYYRNMTLWHYGANPWGCNDIQDDLSVITGNGNGITYRDDDYGNTAAAAADASFANNAFSVQGIIEQPGDVDAVKFTVPSTGRFTLDALPYSVATGNAGADIDLEIQLLNKNREVLGVYNDPLTLSSSIDTTLPAGTYYLLVQGKGNENAPDYASLGSYTLNAKLSPGNILPVHKLQLGGTTENKQHKLQWEIVADEKLVNQTVEVAVNGAGFAPLFSGNENARAYTYTPSANSILYYRLKAMFDDGRTYYSNTIALRSSGVGAKPSLVGNATNGSLTVSSPSAYTYTIVDVAGRSLAKGNLSQGLNILSPALSSAGIYLILFDNGTEHYAEKFSKQ